VTAWYATWQLLKGSDKAIVGFRSALVKKSGEHGKHNLKSCHCLANAAEE
jgi:hypothetical protein